MSLSRREFVRTASVAVLAGEVRSVGAQIPSPDLQSLKLGLASYTFRQFDRAQVIAWMKELKLDSINAKDVKDHLPADPAGEAQALAAYRTAGITVHAVGAVYFPNDDSAIQAKFEYAKRAGASVIVAGDPTVAMLPRIETFARQYDIRVAIHNHGPEDELWPSPLNVLQAVKGMDPRMGCCIDVGHAARAGTNVIEAVHAVGPRLFNVHMKDLANTQSKESQVAVGEGLLPVAGIFEALKAIRYQGYVDLEYEIHEDDPMPGVRTSFAYMRGVLAGMSIKS